MNGHFIDRMFWGLFLIAIGVLFLLQQTGHIPMDIGQIFSTYWPVFVIFFGLKALLMQRRYHVGWSGAYLWNGLVVVIGLMFLGKNTGFLDVEFQDFYKFIVPLLLIVFGLSMLFKPFRKPRRREGEDPYENHYNYKYEIQHPDDLLPKHDKDKAAQKPAGTESQKQTKGYYGNHYADGDTYERSSFLGDLHLGNDYWELKPMNVSHFIGDTILDLTKAQIPYGETKIQVSAFIGDVKIYVPSDMELEVSVISNSFIGDIRVFDRREGGFFKNMQVEPPRYRDAEKKIKLIVSMFVGDVRVQKV